jgi:hypothetical protein
MMQAFLRLGRILGLIGLFLLQLYIGLLFGGGLLLSALSGDPLPLVFLVAGFLVGLLIARHPSVTERLSTLILLILSGVGFLFLTLSMDLDAVRAVVIGIILALSLATFRHLLRMLVSSYNL